VSNSSSFNIRAKVLKRLQDLQLNEREFQTTGVLTLKALADTVNDVCSTVSNRCLTNVKIIFFLNSNLDC